MWDDQKVAGIPRGEASSGNPDLQINHPTLEMLGQPRVDWPFSRGHVPIRLAARPVVEQRQISQSLTRILKSAMIASPSRWRSVEIWRAEMRALDLPHVVDTVSSMEPSGMRVLTVYTDLPTAPGSPEFDGELLYKLEKTVEGKLYPKHRYDRIDLKPTGKR
jgi:hypothetical protein